MVQTCQRRIDEHVHPAEIVLVTTLDISRSFKQADWIGPAMTPRPQMNWQDNGNSFWRKQFTLGKQLTVQNCFLLPLLTDQQSEGYSGTPHNSNRSFFLKPHKIRTELQSVLCLPNGNILAQFKGISWKIHVDETQRQRNFSSVFPIVNQPLFNVNSSLVRQDSFNFSSG